MNIWIPDGYKDIPEDRLGPRARFKDSLDQILSIPYDRSKVYVCLKSKVFGIDLESYTFGSSEICLNYAAKNGIISLMDIIIRGGFGQASDDYAGGVPHAGKRF